MTGPPKPRPGDGKPAHLVGTARLCAQELLAESLPRRWFHTVGVAATARRLARVLTPSHADDIVAAAWLHDIGYAPHLADTGFHPIDGARYAQQAGFTAGVANLIAHHTGALFEARERGLSDQLPAFPFPVDAAGLAILNCADLSTGPNGESVEPAARIAEVLHRYPPTSPVHRAIVTSAPLLLAQAQQVLLVANDPNSVNQLADVRSSDEAFRFGRGHNPNPRAGRDQW